MKQNENELIRLGFEESDANNEIEIFCEPCFKTFNDKVEASHESHNVEMCFDCYQEFNE
tara:strand:- start:194 stop:370 length:177 start_codon:yes stop_codon:yes gene_type:complete